MIKPKISTVKSLAKTHKVTKGAVMLLFDEDGAFACVTYGINKHECDEIRAYGEEIICSLENGDNTPY